MKKSVFILRGQRERGGGESLALRGKRCHFGAGAVKCLAVLVCLR